MALATLAIVKAEGGFLKEQFNKASDAELDGILEQRSEEAAAELLDRVGADTYASADAVVAQVLATAEVYLATAKAFQTILNILVTWDAEALPSEFVDSEELSAIIARYRGAADRLIAPYEGSVREGARPYLRSRSIEP